MPLDVDEVSALPLMPRICIRSLRWGKDTSWRFEFNSMSPWKPTVTSVVVYE